MARGDVRVINNSKSVSKGVLTDIDVTCNANEMLTGGGWITDVPITIHRFCSVNGGQTWTMQVTPSANGQVTVQAHAIEV